MAFAFMRNSHEALRAAVVVMEGFLLTGNVPEFKTAWKDYKRAILVHAEMEDNNMFPLLDKVNGSELNLHHLHLDEEKLTKSLDDAVAANDQTVLVDSFRAWQVRSMKPMNSIHNR